MLEEQCTGEVSHFLLTAHTHTHFNFFIMYDQMGQGW